MRRGSDSTGVEEGRKPVKRCRVAAGLLGSGLGVILGIGPKSCQSAGIPAFGAGILGAQTVLPGAGTALQA